MIVGGLSQRVHTVILSQNRHIFSNLFFPRINSKANHIQRLKVTLNSDFMKFIVFNFNIFPTEICIRETSRLHSYSCLGKPVFVIVRRIFVTSLPYSRCTCFSPVWTQSTEKSTLITEAAKSLSISFISLLPFFASSFCCYSLNSPLIRSNRIHLHTIWSVSQNEKRSEHKQRTRGWMREWGKTGQPKNRTHQNQQQRKKNTEKYRTNHPSAWNIFTKWNEYFTSEIVRICLHDWYVQMHLQIKLMCFSKLLLWIVNIVQFQSQSVYGILFFFRCTVAQCKGRKKFRISCVCVESSL